MRTSFQLVSTNVCSDHNREDNASGSLISVSQSHRLPLTLFSLIVLVPFFVSRFTSTNHDVYTGGSLLRIMQHFQVLTPTYGFLLNGIPLDDTFFIQILEVLLVVILAKTTHYLTIICPYEQETHDATHHFPHTHCSQIILEDFFSLVYLPFSS